MRKIFEQEAERIRLEIRVVVTTYKEMHRLYKMSCENSWGSFHMNGPDDEKLIFLHKRNPYYRKLWLLFHEYGHYQCYLQKCSCFEHFFHSDGRRKYIDFHLVKTNPIKSVVLCESHANRYALDVCHKKGYKKSEQDLISIIKKYRTTSNNKNRFVYEKMIEEKIISDK